MGVAAQKVNQNLPNLGFTAHDLSFDAHGAAYDFSFQFSLNTKKASRPTDQEAF